MRESTTKPVKPIPPSPPWDEKLVIKYMIAGRLMDLEVCLSRQENDPNQHPDWSIMPTWFGSVAVRILS